MNIVVVLNKDVLSCDCCWNSDLKKEKIIMPFRTMGSLTVLRDGIGPACDCKGCCGMPG